MDSQQSTQSSSLREISDVTRSYSIRKQRSAHRYRVTIPSRVLEELDIENGDDLGFWIRSTQDGKLQLIYETATNSCNILTSVSKHSSGEFTIPSAVGAASSLEEENIEWTTFEKGSTGSYLIAGTTTKELSTHSSQGATSFGTRTLKHVPQKVTHDGADWNQEHFQLYLPVEEAEQVGWEDGEILGLMLISIDGSIGLKFTRNETQVDEKSRKKVQKTGDNQRDRLIFPPNGLVRSLKLLDQPLSLYCTQAGSLLTTRN